MPEVRAAKECAAALIEGRSEGSGDSILSSRGVMGPLGRGSSKSPAATRCSSAMGFWSLPNGGAPSSAAYNVAPRGEHVGGEIRRRTPGDLW